LSLVHNNYIAIRFSISMKESVVTIILPNDIVCVCVCVSLCVCVCVCVSVCHARLSAMSQCSVAGCELIIPVLISQRFSGALTCVGLGGRERGRERERSMFFFSRHSPNVTGSSGADRRSTKSEGRSERHPA